MKTYLWAILIGFNRFVSACLFGRPHNTISGVTGHYAQQGYKLAGVAQRIINTLFCDDRHCEKAVVFDRRHGGTFK